MKKILKTIIIFIFMLLIKVDVTKAYFLESTYHTYENTLFALNTSDNYLKSLVITDVDALVFNKERSSYSVSVPYSVETVKITATAENNRSTVSIDRDGKLNVGINTFIITVTDKDKNVRAYTVNITRNDNKAPTLSNNTNLTSITIGNKALEFNKEIHEYEVEVFPTVKSLNISYVVEDSKAKVEIVDNENLTKGSIVRIIVTAEDGTTKEYAISVTFMDITLLVIGAVVIVFLFMAVIYHLFTRKKAPKEREQVTTIKEPTSQKYDHDPTILSGSTNSLFNSTPTPHTPSENTVTSRVNYKECPRCKTKNSSSRTTCYNCKEPL